MFSNVFLNYQLFRYWCGLLVALYRRVVFHVFLRVVERGVLVIEEVSVLAFFVEWVLDGEVAFGGGLDVGSFRAVDEDFVVETRFRVLPAADDVPLAVARQVLARHFSPVFHDVWSWGQSSRSAWTNTLVSLTLHPHRG